MFGLMHSHVMHTPRSTNDYLALFGCNRGQLHFQPPGECKDNMWSDYGNTVDIEYPNTLGFKSFTSSKDLVLSDNVRIIRQVPDIGLLGLESLVTITACGTHTLPPPFYFITTAWSVLEIITISFSFLYFIYHAVNFILCSLSDVW